MLTLVRYVPDTNSTRFYSFSLQQDFFEGVSLIREWGRIGQAGRVVINRYLNQEAAITMLKKFKKAKEKKCQEQPFTELSQKPLALYDSMNKYEYRLL